MIRLLNAAITGVLLSACAPSTELPQEVVDTQIDTQSAAIDFGSLLRRTDAIEVCASHTERIAVESYGADYVPDGFVVASCACLRDSVLFATQQVRPDQPVLQNAIVQASINLDVVEIIFRDKDGEDRFPAFMTYLSERGLDELGFDFQAFQSALVEASAVNATIKRKELLEGVPSCAETVSLSRSIFPHVNHVADPYYADRAYAVRRFERDPNIDVDKLDAILRTETPLMTCQDVFTQMKGQSIPFERREANCRRFFCGINTALAGQSDAYKLMAARLSLAIMYVEFNKTTSDSDDLIHYSLEPSKGFGWTAAQLLWIVDPLASEFDSSPWNHFVNVLNDIIDATDIDPTVEPDGFIETAYVFEPCAHPVPS